MARVEVPITVINSSTGIPVEGAAVAISHRNSGLPATWYPSENGGAASTSAVITDANGRVHAWLARGGYNLAVTGTGITPYTEAWDATPATDGSVDPDWISTSALLPGEVKLYGGSAIPAGWLVCDGSQVSRTLYPRLWAALGTAWGAGDGSTTFNLPDFRGKVPVGAGQGTGLTNRTLGASGGTESHVLTAAQSGVGPHVHTTIAAGSHSHGGLTGASDRSLSHTHGGSVGSMIFGANVPYVTSGAAVVDLDIDAAGSGFLVPRAQSGFSWGNWNPTHNHTLSIDAASTPDHLHGIGADGNHTHTVSSNSADASQSHPIMQPFGVVNYIIKT